MGNSLSTGQIVILGFVSIFFALLVLLSLFGIYTHHKARSETVELGRDATGKWKDGEGEGFEIRRVPRPVSAGRKMGVGVGVGKISFVPPVPPVPPVPTGPMIPPKTGTRLGGMSVSKGPETRSRETRNVEPQNRGVESSKGRQSGWSSSSSRGSSK